MNESRVILLRFVYLARILGQMGLWAR